jgi:hypothetical protein
MEAIPPQLLDWTIVLASIIAFSSSGVGGDRPTHTFPSTVIRKPEWTLIRI